MKKFKKRKGSSLIVVIFITAIIFTVATTMVAVVTNDYKTRVNESKKLQNLYQSDAGLDVAYNLIAKNAQNATMYAYNYVKDKYDHNQITNEQDLKTEFDKQFYNFFDNDSLKTMINETSVRKCTISDLEHASAADVGNIDNYKGNNAFEKLEAKDIKEITGSNDQQNGKLTLVPYSGSSNYETNTKNGKITGITITVISEFESDNTSSDGSEINGKLKNTRKIKTKYTIEAPDYNAPGTQEAVGSKEYKSYNVEKAITADGNLNIKNANLTIDGKSKDKDGNDIGIDGDIWIKGNENPGSNSDYYDVANKYAYGVRLNNSTLNISGNVYTNGTLGLSNNSNVNVNKNLYAFNAYTGPIMKTDFTADNGGNTLTANDIYTNNDLVMNSGSSNITAENYVGLSDSKEKSTNEGSAASKEKAAKNSSAIIVNTDSNKRDGATIKIDTATVPGFGYMNTAGNSFYGTAESVAVKGNYIAYTEDFNDSGKTDYDPVSKEKYDTKIFKPWDLVNYDNKDDQAKNFELYWNSKGNVDDGGVVINTLYANGAAAYQDENGKQIQGNTSLETKKTVDNNRKAASALYGKYVYGMGQDEFDGKAKSGSEFYSDGENNMLTVAHGNAVVNFDELDGRLNKTASDGTSAKDILLNPIATGGIYKNFNGYALLNGNSSVDLNISENNGTITVEYSDGAKFDIPSNELNAVILTNGNVNISGKLKINGTIIAGGDVNIADGSDVAVTCDRVIIPQIINKVNSTIKVDTQSGKKGILEDICKSTPIEEEQPYIEQNDRLSIAGQIDKSAINGWYDADKYIKQGLWKLVKN